VLTSGGLEVARLISTGAYGFGFSRYVEGAARALYKRTISGDGTVFVVSSPVASLGLAGVQVARLGETILPSGGSATFNGGYAGLLLNPGMTQAGVIPGNPQLTADFANASISGDVTKRLFGGSTADDMLLPPAVTPTGAFSVPPLAGMSVPQWLVAVRKSTCSSVTRVTKLLLA